MYRIYINIHHGTARLYQMVFKVREFVQVFENLDALKKWLKDNRNVVLNDNNSEIWYTEDFIKE